MNHPRLQVGKMETALKMALKKKPRAFIEAPAPACTDKKATMSLVRRLAEEQDAVGACRQQVARLEERLKNESTLGDSAIRDIIVGLVSDVLMLTVPLSYLKCPFSQPGSGTCRLFELWSGASSAHVDRQLEPRAPARQVKGDLHWFMLVIT